MTTDIVVTKLDSASRALAQANTPATLKAVIDAAAAATVYAQRQKLGAEVIAHANSIRLDAERKLGSILAATPNAKPGPKAELGTSAVPNSPPTLAELGIDKKTSARAQRLADLPDETFEAVRAGKKSPSAAIKEHKAHVVVESYRAMANADHGVAWQAWQGDIRGDAWKRGDLLYDCIVTDPPYPAEFLPLYSTLSGVARQCLKPGGSLVVMSGQAHLPEVIARLSEQMRYQWCAAYLTPGGQAVQVFPRKVNTFWKPLLWYTVDGYSGPWIGDVTRSAVNDNDKRMHGWGQSESGMLDVIERFSKPGDLVFDPFMGAGTTGVAALRAGRRFCGMDINAEHVDVARGRLTEAESAAVPD